MSALRQSHRGYQSRDQGCARAYAARGLSISFAYRNESSRANLSIVEVDFTSLTPILQEDSPLPRGLSTSIILGNELLVSGILWGPPSDG